MTRLIDADAVYKILESYEIRKATIGNPLSDWEYGYTCGIERAESEIECAPDIAAISIDWIEEWCLSQDLEYVRIAIKKMMDNWKAERKEE